jgi:hypothetical protein
MGKMDYESRIQMLFDETLKDEDILQDDIEYINYYNLLCKSISTNKFYKFFNANLSLFKFIYKGNESVLMIFSIPIQTNKDVQDKKHITERVMEIVKILEKVFITTEFMSLQEVKEDKYYYLSVIVKKR